MLMLIIGCIIDWDWLIYIYIRAVDLESYRVCFQWIDKIMYRVEKGG